MTLLILADVRMTTVILRMKNLLRSYQCIERAGNWKLLQQKALQQLFVFKLIYAKDLEEKKSSLQCSSLCARVKSASWFFSRCLLHLSARNQHSLSTRVLLSRTDRFTFIKHPLWSALFKWRNDSVALRSTCSEIQEYGASYPVKVEPMESWDDSSSSASVHIEMPKDELLASTYIATPRNYCWTQTSLS